MSVFVCLSVLVFVHDWKVMMMERAHSVQHKLFCGWRAGMPGRRPTHIFRVCLVFYCRLLFICGGHVQRLAGRITRKYQAAFWALRKDTGGYTMGSLVVFFSPILYQKLRVGRKWVADGILFFSILIGGRNRGSMFGLSCRPSAIVGTVVGFSSVGFNL